MSSFLHSAKHFNSIEKSLIQLKKRTQGSWFCYGISESEIEASIETLRKFSAICVINQYAHHYDHPQNEIDLSYSELKLDNSFQILKPIELWKAINSMEYQIEINYLGRDMTDFEKDCMNKFNQIKNNLAELIISSLPEYDKANSWSI